jgi:hypothetical protein
MLRPYHGEPISHGWDVEDVDDTNKFDASPLDSLLGIAEEGELGAGGEPNA